MNLFLFDDDTVPLPPVTLTQSFHRVLTVFDALSRKLGPTPPFPMRCREDVLVDAKAVDERVRAGERLPLAGTLVTAPASSLLSRRLVGAGAVVAGHTGTAAGKPVSHVRAATLGKLDALVLPEPPTVCRDVAGFLPTRGLIPQEPADGTTVRSRRAAGTTGPVTILARDIAVGQQVAAALTGPDPDSGYGRSWPDSVRLSAGAHPRIGVPRGECLGAHDAVTQERIADTAATLRIAGAVVSDIDLGPSDGWCLRRTAFALRDHEALLVPVDNTANSLATLAARLDTAAVVVPGAGDGGPVGVLTKGFDDQVALDIAGLLTGAQAPTPYPDVGVSLVAFGAYLRGQPRAVDLDAVGARFVEFVTTAARYRLLLINQDPPEAGVVATPHPYQGGALLGERWVLSPSALGAFVAHLPAPMRLGTVDLADGSSSPAVLSDPAVAEYGVDVTEWECWRAYLRHLSTQRPVAARAGS